MRPQDAPGNVRISALTKAGELTDNEFAATP